MASSDPDPALVSEAMEAFVDDDFVSAFELYTKLVDASPTHASSWVHRSATLLKLGKPAEALSDADKATALDPRNSKAHLRRGMALFDLGRHEEARASFETGRALDPMSKQLLTWLGKCDERVAAAGPPASATQPRPAYKHQWYQSQTHVTLEVMAKNVDPADATFDLTPERVVVVVRGKGDADPDGAADYRLDVRLFGGIVPEESKCAVLGSKLEIRLRKSEAIQWGDLFASARAATTATQPLNFSDPGMSRPTYPSSKAAQMKKPTDWDKLEADLAKEEEEEEPTGDAALNKLFQDIYGKADDETRRAMNKSFQESGGTVLSTNWAEIGAKRTEVQPPTGMEAKTYEQ